MWKNFDRKLSMEYGKNRASERREEKREKENKKREKTPLPLIKCCTIEIRDKNSFMYKLKLD